MSSIRRFATAAAFLGALLVAAPAWANTGYSNIFTVDLRDCTAPSITEQPQSITISSGQNATLTVTAAGTAPFTYQWYKGSVGDTSTPVGSDSASYDTGPLTQSTSYWVRVSNGCGASTDSNAATVTISSGGLVLWYTLNGSASDQSGHSNNGTIVGPVTFVPGRSDQSAYFDNPAGSADATQWIQLPSASPTLEALRTSSISIAVCYKTTDSSRGNGRLFGNIQAASWIVMDYNADATSNAYVQVFDGSNAYAAGNSVDNASAITTDGQYHWQILLLDRSSGVLKEYVDQNLIESVQVTDLGPISLQGLVLGASQPSDNYAARQTTVDELRIYDHALTVSEIESLVSGSSCSINCSCTVPQTGTVWTPVSFTATAMPTGCSGTPTYDWDFGDGTAHGNGANTSHTYATAGTFTWTLTVSMAGASPCTKSDSIVISQTSFGQFTSPTSGAVLLPGDSIPIQWSYTGTQGGDAATVYLVPDGGSPVAIAKTTMGGSLPEPWWVPGGGSAGYKLRLSSDGGAESFDSGAFTIQAPARDQVVWRAVNGVTGQPWNAGSATLKQAWTFGHDTIAPDASQVGLYKWNLDLYPLVGSTPAHLNPGDRVTLSYDAGASTKWPVDMLFYPRNEDPQVQVKESFFFEHRVYPDWPTGQGYPFFTMIRYPKDGLVNPDKQPVVFIHGVGGGQGYWNAGDGLPELMASKGYEVWEVSYPPLEAVQSSGYALYQALKRIWSLRGGGGNKLHVVAHSMGGMVARTIMEDLTKYKGTGRGLSSPSPVELIGKVVFLQSPMHGSHSINGARGESGCGILDYLIVNGNLGLPDDCGAAIDLALASPLVFELNQGGNAAKMSQFDLLALVGKGTYAGGCEESPNANGSYDDGAVLQASGNTNQRAIDANGSTQEVSGKPILQLAHNHGLPGEPSTNGVVVSAGIAIDTFFKNATLAGTPIQQTQGLPLVRLRANGGTPKWKYLRIGYPEWSSARTMHRINTPSNTYNFYTWSGIFNGYDFSDLDPGSYTLYGYVSWLAWRRDSGADTVHALEIPAGGKAVVAVFTAPSTFAAESGSASHELIFVGLSPSEDLAIGLTSTDPSGKVLSATRNDYTDGSQYLEEDFNQDGFKDCILVINTPVDGNYAIAWAASQGSSPTAQFLITGLQDGTALSILPKTYLYSSSSGTVTYPCTLGSPSQVTDLAAAKGADGGVVEVGWTDPAGLGSDASYDLRFSTSSIATEEDFDNASAVTAPLSSTSGSHRLQLPMGESGQTYYFRLKVYGENGLGSPLSNEASAVSGPGGSGLNGDQTPPTTPVVTDQGDSTNMPGSLSFTWSASDAESGVSSYQYAVGTHPSGADVVAWTSAGSSTSVTVSDNAITGGRTYYCTVVATNGAALDSLPGSTDGIRVNDFCSDDAYEPDNDPSQARAIIQGSPQTHNLCKDDDFFVFQAQQGTTYEIKTYALEALCKTRLILMDGTTYGVLSEAGYDTSDAEFPFSSRLVWTAPTAGSFVFGVLSGDGSYGAYHGYTAVLRVPDALPAVAITSPVSGSEVTGLVSVDATASDDHGVTMVEFLLDGVLKSTDASAPYGWSWDTSQATAGWHTITARATDTYGQQVEDSVSVEVTAACVLICTATVPATGTIGSAVAFASTATATNCTGSPNFDWNFGDGSANSSQQNPSHSYLYPAIYTWHLTVSVNGQTCAESGTITISADCTAPSITTQPASQTITSGQSVTLSVVAEGTPPFAYQWYQGQSGDTSTLVGNALTYNTGALTQTTSYWVRVSNGCGASTDSNTATVSVCTPASISAPPQSITIPTGTSTTLSVTAAGSGPLTYQWYEGTSGNTSTPVGSSSASFTTPALTSTTSYWVRVSNGCGTPASSATATVTVTSSSDLLAQWTFDDGTAHDVSGNGHDGTISGAASVPGHCGNAMSFGTGNTITASPINQNTSLTVAAWVFPKASQAGQAYTILYERKNGGGDSCGGSAGTYALQIYDNTFAFELNTRDDSYNCLFKRLRAPGAPQLNAWSFVAGTYDRVSGAINLYVNGALAAQDVGSGNLRTLFPSDSPIISFGKNPGANQYWQGKIDNTWIFSRALSQAEIQQLSAGCGSSCPAITLAPTSLPAGTVGMAYSQTITATGGTAPYTYTITSGSLPAGVLLGSGGSVSGLPSAAGTYTFTVTATDPSAQHCTGNRAYTVTVLSTACAVWSFTGSMGTARELHSATLLPSGKVLMAGGYDGAIRLGNAELYNPLTGTWSPTGSMATARDGHTATLLSNGKVLVAGGYDGATQLRTAELYDPVTGTWRSTGSMFTARDGHTATLLPSGKVLVVGGICNGVFLDSAETYDPTSGIWASTGSLSTARVQHTATLLLTGKVLVVGGAWGLTSSELYDPATESWNSTGSLGTARFGHTATLLRNGKVLVATGHNTVIGNISSAELYDPITQTWSATGTMDMARYRSTASLLFSGKVLVIGGGQSDADLYDPLLGTWTFTGPLTNAREWHSATLLTDGQVLVGGGHDSNANPMMSAELYNACPGSICAFDCVPVVPSTGLVGTEIAFWAEVRRASCHASPTFDWDFADGSAHSTLQYPTHAYDGIGTYRWKLTVTVDGQVCTKTADISICTPVSITTQPQSVTIPTGTTTTLSVTATGTAPLSYQWYQGTSGNTSTPVGSNSASFTTPALTTATSYWVRANNVCGTPADSPTATVSVCTPAAISAPPQSITIPTGTSTTLSVMAAGSGTLNYQWYQGTSGNTSTPVGSSSASFTTPALATATSYWVRVSNGCGTPADSSTATVSVCTPVAITVQPQSTGVFPRTSATLAVTTTGSGTLAYQWYLGASGDTSNPISGARSSAYTTPALTVATSYWVRVSNGCGTAADSATATVSICSLSCGATLSVSSGIAPLPVTFSGSSTILGPCAAQASYDWNFGDGTAHSSEQNPTHTYATGGTRTWTLTVTTGGQSCTQTGTILVCTLYCTASASTASGMAPLAVSFSGSAIQGGCTQAVTYAWDFGDGSAASNAQNPSHTYASAGSYAWTFTVTAGGQTCTKTGTVAVCALSCSGAAPSKGTAGLAVAFSGSGSVTGACSHSVAYDWDFGDGSAHSNLQNPSHSYTSASTFTWTLRVTAGGATCTKTGSITIVNPPVISSMTKLVPFGIKVSGSNMQNGIRVFIKGAEWTNMQWKNAGKVKILGGNALKLVVPKGTPTSFRFVNPDGGEYSQTWGW